MDLEGTPGPAAAAPLSEPVDERGLGRFREVSALQAVGGSEPTHFTPWLARHVDVVGEVIGLELRILDTADDELITGQHVEVPVHEYFLDIRAVDAAGRIVAIENQYGLGDHKHLGQIITYASGVGADVLVWVAETFSDGHLQAIHWLNERTDEQCGVFAVRARFLQIGDSPPAPAFELVAAPSDWARNQRRSTNAQRESWTKERFLEDLTDERDRAAVTELFRLVESTELRGKSGHYWYGAYPNGSLFLHPHGLRYAPAALWVNSKGRAVVTGLWNNWPSIGSHGGFSHVADVLGQDHLSPSSKGRLLAELNFDALWVAMEATTLAINAPDTDPVA